MNRRQVWRGLFAGWMGGFVGNAVLGAAFMSPWVRQVLYDPALQSPTFLALAPQRNIAVSVIGLVLLSGLHGLLYVQLRPALPGRSWLVRGVCWGAILWALYWLFQEWFIYVTLLGEPLPLAAFELSLLLAGALIEGAVIAGICERPAAAR